MKANTVGLRLTVGSEEAKRLEEYLTRADVRDIVSEPYIVVSGSNAYYALNILREDKILDMVTELKKILPNHLIVPSHNPFSFEAVPEKSPEDLEEIAGMLEEMGRREKRN